MPSKLQRGVLLVTVTEIHAEINKDLVGTVTQTGCLKKILKSIKMFDLFDQNHNTSHAAVVFYRY